MWALVTVAAVRNRGDLDRLAVSQAKGQRTEAPITPADQPFANHLSFWLGPVAAGLELRN